MKHLCHLCMFLLIVLVISPLAYSDQPTRVDSPTNNLGKKIENLNTEVVQLKNILNLSIEEIKFLRQENNALKSEISTQSDDIKKFVKKLETSDLIKEIIYPIILSIIAAVVFWFTFSFFPEKLRYKKIRVKIALNFYQIYTNMFSLFDTVMKANTHSSSHFQKNIRSINLKKGDFELGLQNKCLNEHYLFYPEIRHALLPIGKSLYERGKKIDGTIDRLFGFSFYLQPDVILLLEKIRTKLNTYDLDNYNRQAISIIGNQKLYPVNPSLSYMRNNIFELFELFAELQQMVFKEKSLDSELCIVKAQYYFYTGEYNACISHVRNIIKKSQKNRLFFYFYIFLSEYAKGNLETAYAKLTQILAERPNLVSHRSFLKDLLDDERVNTILKKNYSATEIQEMISVVRKEHKQKKDFIKNAKTLQNFYFEKGKQADKTEEINS